MSDPAARPTTRSRWIRAALRIVPRDWRDAVGRDLAEERAPARRNDPWRAAHIVRIGLALRAARAVAVVGAAARGASVGFGTDVRLAIRVIGRERASAAAIVVTLALGIGATTATYAVFNTILFRPIPGLSDPDRLVTIDAGPNFSWRRLASLMRGLPGLDGPGVGYKTPEAVAFDQGQAEVADVMVVTEGYLRALGVRPRIGRLITDQEATAGADVAVISERAWRTRFAARDSALGAPIDISGERFTIVGVVDRYEEWGTSRVGTVVAWVPGGSGEKLFARMRRADTGLVVGRLMPGAVPSVVEAEARGRFAAAVAGTPDARRVVALQTGLQVDGSGDVERQALLVYRFAIGAGVLLLLLACANAANLLLARLARRERAFALRTAIGATRARLLRPVFVESAVMTVAATALGLGVAEFLTRLLRGVRLFRSAPTLVDVPLDWRVVIFATATAAATLVAFTVLPALMGSRADARGLLQQTSRGTSGRSRLRHTFVVVQLALALLLAAAAGVLTRSVAYVRHLDLGLRPDGVVEFRLDAIQLAYGVGATNRQFDKGVVETLARLPGVRSAGVASPSVFDDEQFAMLVRPAESPEVSPLSCAHWTVSGGYFATLGIQILAGRTFADAEYLAGPARPGSAAVLGETAAKRLFGTPAAALGRHVTVSDARFVSDPRWHDVEIVGVVGDTRSGSNYLRGAAAAIYEPDNSPWGPSTFYVASGVSAPLMEEQLRAAMRALVPGMPVQDMRTVRDEIDAMFPEERLIAMVLRTIAGLAVTLGLFGVAAVMAFTLSERTRELGIRVALGASAGRVMLDALRPAIGAAALGAVLGVGLYGAGSRVLASRLHGVHALDPLTIAGTTAALLVAAMVAAWLPARRAGRLDPTIALRTE